MLTKSLFILIFFLLLNVYGVTPTFLITIIFPYFNHRSIASFKRSVKHWSRIKPINKYTVGYISDSINLPTVARVFGKFILLLRIKFLLTNRSPISGLTKIL